MKLDGLRRHLLDVTQDRVTLSFTEVERLIGGPLPASARKHAGAFWSNASSRSRAWREAGFVVSRTGCLPEHVAFVRSAVGTDPEVTGQDLGSPGPEKRSAALRASSTSGRQVVLVGCVKTKRDHAAPAEDLYASPLFRRRREFAESTGRPWFILSAKYGLVAPDEVIAPYDLAMAGQRLDYRKAWAGFVAEQLVDALGALWGIHFEMHAGAAYVEPLEVVLRAHGASVTAPLRGLTQGEHLAWYAAGERDEGLAAVIEVDSSPPALAGGERTRVDVDPFVATLGAAGAARPAADFPWGSPADFNDAGLYSWWVDAAGAGMLSDGLGVEVDAGLIYAGQTGATAWPSGTRRTSTLLKRIQGNHLRGSISGSTFRLTLAAILSRPLGLASDGSFGGEDEAALSAWMGAHLRVTAVVLPDRDALAVAERSALTVLDPPLNLSGMTPTPLRLRLRELRASVPTGGEESPRADG